MTDELFGRGIGGGNAVQQGKQLLKLNSVPTLEEQLLSEIEKTEERLEAMKAAVEIIRQMPDFEKLSRGLAMLHRNY